MRDWDSKDWFSVLLAIIAIISLLVTVINSASAAAPESTKTTFDHSTCQYPERSTNPPDGCDNSDPCDPTNVKGGGTGECTTPVPVSVEIPMSQNITIPKKACE